MSDTRRILVAGDHGFDYNFYLPTHEDNPPPHTPPTEVRITLGGAGISLRVLQAIVARANGEKRIEVGFAPSAETVVSPPSLAFWQKSKFGKLGKNPLDEDEDVWRTLRSMSLGTVATGLSLPTVPMPDAAPASFQPDIVLVEDNAGGYRFQVPAWLEPLTRVKAKGVTLGPRPRWIVLKTSAPVGHGSFWWSLSGSQELTDRLIVIVSINDLRRSEIRVSQGISWERTALDLCRELVHSPALEGLRYARHVIVTLQSEGALWMTRSCSDQGAEEDRSFTLIFDPGHMEGEWAREFCGAAGEAYGYHSTFAASIAAHLTMSAPEESEQGLTTGIKNGLRAMRLLRASGHGTTKRIEPGLPVEALAAMIMENDPAKLSGALPDLPHAEWSRLGAMGLISSRQPAGKNQAGSTPTLAGLRPPGSEWRILESGDEGREATQPLYGLARRVAVLGLDALANVPYARFGDLFTVDRDEIEALRNIQRLLLDYERQTDNTRPLSLAVFGPPGSGKSFGVKQVARTVIGERQQAFLEFNLSQFDDPADLVGALHQVRDKVLEGKLPIVFWDEFDSRAFMWLQFLLAPMQDGKFQEGQVTHPIGRCIFVFAGATSYHFDHFGPPESSLSSEPIAIQEHREAVADFRLKKGPDFKSRIHGCLNVLGPNPRQQFDPAKPLGKQWTDDLTDVCFPVRRAVLLRSWLGLMSPKKKKDRKRLVMDPGLLAALLEVGHYKHGARSMEKIVMTIKLGDLSTYHRSALPTNEVLQMNVREIDQFLEIMDQPRAFQQHAWRLAPAIHAAWFDLGDQENAYKTEFEKLPPEAKGDNYAAAVRIPNLLGLVGLQLVDQLDNQPAVSGVEDILKRNLELLAEEEHNGWMDVKMANGWTGAPDPQDNKEELKKQRAGRRNHCIAPYATLSPEYQNMDMTSIRNIPTVARLAGFKIVARRPPDTCS